MAYTSEKYQKVYDSENFIIFQYDSKKICHSRYKGKQSIDESQFHSDDTESVALINITAKDIRRYPEGFLL